MYTIRVLDDDFGPISAHRHRNLLQFSVNGQLIPDAVCNLTVYIEQVDFSRLHGDAHKVQNLQQNTTM